MRWAIVVVFAAFSSAAHAQAAPCRKSLFHPTSCSSAPQPAVTGSPATDVAQPAVVVAPRRPVAAATSAAADPRLVSPYTCNLAQQITLGGAVCQARQVSEVHRRVGSLVHEGRCGEAVKVALSTGDTAFAGRVGDYCVDRR